MTTQRIILAGGSGALGRALIPQLVARGFDVVVLTRSPFASTENVRQIQWDGKTVGPWAAELDGAELDGAEAVINFTGKSVNCRYTMRNRQEIVKSRVDSVNAIGQAIGRCTRAPKCSVQTASLAIYGDGGNRICDESVPPGSGFSVETCMRWESAFNGTDTPQTRKIILRIGFVLGRGEGALGTLEKLTRRFLGGAAGDGRQYISWIHSSDMNRLFLETITRADLAGMYNVTRSSHQRRVYASTSSCAASALESSIASVGRKDWRQINGNRGRTGSGGKAMYTEETVAGWV